MIIRKTTENDVNLIYEMINELAIYEKRPEDMTGSTKMLKLWLFEKKIATAVIAEIEGKAIGYAIYYPIFASFSMKANVHIEDLYIKPEYRGQGFGKKFFYELVEMIKSEGYSKLEWSCLDWNTPAIEFYKKIGALKDTGRVYFEYQLKNDL
ncbi:MAG: GNAT family N-acetyltransferase [Acholeplasmatales bacterium]|nr:GNAT family N-acetyltransferase [Acholeplasmatales bacterium]